MANNITGGINIFSAHRTHLFGMNNLWTKIQTDEIDRLQNIWKGMFWHQGELTQGELTHVGVWNVTERDLSHIGCIPT